MSLANLPDDLPVPVDDGGCDNLPGMQLPDLLLSATNGSDINLSDLSGTTIIYIYPLTGRPDTPLPDGWDQIPGARGCTPQSCSFRDHHKELQKLNVNVFGLSTQATAYQQEAVERLHLPFLLLSDELLKFVRSLSLPTMEIQNMTLIKRLILICHDNIISKVFYPVFPPDQSARMVLDHLKT